MRFPTLLAALAVGISTVGVAAAIASGPISADWIARAKVNGIDANDPDLKIKLLRLAEQRRAAHPVPTPGSARPQLRSVPLATGVVLTKIRGLHTARALPPLANLPSIQSVTADPEGALNLTGAHLDSADHVYADTTCGVYDFFGSALQKTPSSIKIPVGFGIDQKQSVSVSAFKGEIASQPVAVDLSPIPGLPFFSKNTEMEYSVARVTDGAGDGNHCTLPCSLSKNPRISTDPTEGEVEGDDVIGYGVKYFNGYSFSSQIDAVWSMNDPPGTMYTAQNNAYRGATIVTGPSDGRLETRIHWYHLGGESINYDLTMTEDGSNANGYFRDRTTNPKQTPCASEQ